MTALWNWLTKKPSKEEMLDDHWDKFVKSYHKFLEKDIENTLPFKNADFCLHLNKFCIHSFFTSNS